MQNSRSQQQQLVENISKNVVHLCCSVIFNSGIYCKKIELEYTIGSNGNFSKNSRKNKTTDTTNSR